MNLIIIFFVQSFVKESSRITLRVLEITSNLGATWVKSTNALLGTINRSAGLKIFDKLSNHHHPCCENNDQHFISYRMRKSAILSEAGHAISTWSRPRIGIGRQSCTANSSSASGSIGSGFRGGVDIHTLCTKRTTGPKLASFLRMVKSAGITFRTLRPKCTTDLRCSRWGILNLGIGFHKLFRGAQRSDCVSLLRLVFRSHILTHKIYNRVMVLKSQMKNSTKYLSLRRWVLHHNSNALHLRKCTRFI